MKSADLLIVKVVHELKERLAQQGRAPSWDGSHATLSWAATQPGVARLCLRLDLVDELTQLAVLSGHRCPVARRAAVALSLMALSIRGPLSGWLLHEGTGEIELRIQRFGLPQAGAGLDSLLSLAGLCEAYVGSHAELLQQLLGGSALPGVPPSSSGLFSAFSK